MCAHTGYHYVQTYEFGFINFILNHKLISKYKKLPKIPEEKKNNTIFRKKNNCNLVSANNGRAPTPRQGYEQCGGGPTQKSPKE